MASSGGYRSAGDNFRSFLDRFRCPAACDGCRCQLYDGHCVPHAHAWLDAVPPGYTRRSGRPYPWFPHLMRWDAESSWLETCGAERLPWCCMFTP